LVGPSVGCGSDGSCAVEVSGGLSAERVAGGLTGRSSDGVAAAESGPGTGKRVIVAMSGGVDSAVAAAVLMERGYQVSGVTMRLWSGEGSCGDSRPAAPEDDARRTCDALGIPFRVVDLRAPFREHVVDYFLTEYVRGRTPNPCLACNRYIKFGLLLQEALSQGAGYLATGHYARVSRYGGGFRLLRGLDRSKDQSYFLYMLGQEQLGHLLLPLGDLTKTQVRAMARARQLPAEGSSESQDLCFISGGDYRRLLLRLAPASVVPGPIVDSTGEVLGQHRGLPFYTVGQRKGLGIAAPEPLYVIGLNVAQNTLIVGPSNELGRTVLVAREVTFVSGLFPSEPLRAEAKIRYQSRPRSVVVVPRGEGRIEVTFERPQRDITPGQAVVLYKGPVVLGGGIIGDQCLCDCGVDADR